MAAEWAEWAAWAVWTSNTGHENGAGGESLPPFFYGIRGMREGSSPFLQKRTKKLLLLGWGIASLAISNAFAEARYSKLAQMQTEFDGIPAAQRNKLILHQTVPHENAADATKRRRDR